MRSDNPQCFWQALLMLGQTAEKLLVIHRSFPEQATASLASGGFVIHVFLFWLLLSSHLWKTVHSLMISFDQFLWAPSPRMQKSLWYCSGHFSGPLCSRPSYSLLCIWSLTPWWCHEPGHWYLALYSTNIHLNYMHFPLTEGCWARYVFTLWYQIKHDPWVWYTGTAFVLQVAKFSACSHVVYWCCYASSTGNVCHWHNS